MSIFDSFYNSDESTGSIRSRLPINLALTAVFTLLQIQQSIAFGRLSAIQQYDDVVYHINGLARLEILRQGGMLALLDSFWNQIMWAPWGVLAATLGFTFFGPDPWSIYVINGLLVLAMLSIIDWLTPGATLRVKVMCWIVALCLPMMGHAITDFRPDFAAAFATAAAILAVLRINASPRARKAAVIAGALAGIALLAKPTIFAATIVYIGIGGMAMTLREIYLCRKNPDSKWRDLFINIVITASTTALVASIHYYRFGHIYFNYFWENTFGDRAKHWDRQLTGFENIEYFLTGPGGILVFGRQLLPLLILAAAGTLSILLSRQSALKNYIIQLWIVSIGCLLIPATNATKNPYFALVFSVLLLIIAMMGLRHMLTSSPNTITKPRRAAQLLLATTIIIWSIAAFDFPRTTPGAITPTSRIGFKPAASDAMTLAIAQALIDARPIADEALKASGKRGQIHTYLTTSGYANKDTLAYLILREGHGRWNFSHGSFLANPEDHIQHIAKAHLIVAVEPGVADEQGRPLIHRYPGDQEVAQTLQIIRADPGLQGVASIPSPAGPATIIFVRTQIQQQIHDDTPKD